MIIVEGWVKLASGEIDRLRDQALAMLEETRKEEGCISYAFSVPIDDPDTLRIAEVWESQEALDAHGQTPHMAEFGKALREATILEASLKAYPAEEGRTLLGG
jgi:quinol monooxygenase YgiN